MMRTAILRNQSSRIDSMTLSMRTDDAHVMMTVSECYDVRPDNIFRPDCR